MARLQVAADRTINVDGPSLNECDLFACPSFRLVYGIGKLITGRTEESCSFRSHSAIEPFRLLGLG